MTRVGMIIDKSGSMMWMRGTAIEGFNAFLEEQQRIGTDAKVTLRLFNNRVENVYSGNIMECPHLDEYNYYPSGGTALLDAIGDTLGKMKKGYDSMSDKPRVLICILTDGEERDSRTWTIDQVRLQVEVCKQLGWEFIFLGAGASWTWGTQLGIDPVNVLDFKANQEGLKKAFEQITASVSRLRLGGQNVDPK